jgi:hypothetical protein
MTGVEVGVALGVELLKLALQERALRQKLVAAGMSEAATDAALSKVRAEVAALPDPKSLPAV